MQYEKCRLYKLSSKKYLKQLLNIQDKRWQKQDYVASKIDPFVDINANGKKRLIEAPSKELKAIQSKIKSLYYTLDFPDNVFSGVKGRSYVNNAKFHIGKRFLYKIDISAFFPSITREQVYEFFISHLLMSPDCAEILTNLTTVNLMQTQSDNINQVLDFINEKFITNCNHLISGAPTSQVMSYLVNKNMFDELQDFSDRNNLMMTVYVDDIFFSSPYFISAKSRNKILSLVTKYGYKISKHKVKYHTKTYPKCVTGIIVNKYGDLALKNSLRLNIIRELNDVKNGTNDSLRLHGLLTAARQINKNVFPSVYKFANKREPKTQ